MSAAIDILHLFPELTAIGQKDLQVYCDEWLKRPIARHSPLKQIVVDEQLMISLHVSRDAQIGTQAFIPMDELLGYIIDQHFIEPDQRRQLHAKVREAREMLRRLGTAYEVTAGRMGMLYLICKNPDCQATLNTSHRGIEGQTVTCPPLPATCPICGQTHSYVGSDFRLKLDGA